MDLVRGGRVHPAPVVSVVIPAYKPKWLDDALDSVRAQSRTDYEIIVVDDGSPEPVAPARADDVVLIRQPNAGPGGARNTGVEHARGALIALLDSDDRWEPSKLERQVALHEAERDLVMSCTDAMLTDGETTRRDKRERQLGRYHGARIPYHRLFLENCIACSSAVIRRDAYRTAGGMPAHRRLGEDYKMWLRLGLLGPIGHVGEPLLMRRQHSESLMFETLIDGSWYARERELYDEVLAEHPQLRTERFVRAAQARLEFQGAYAQIARREWREARRSLLRSLALHPFRWKAWVDLVRATLHIGPRQRALCS